ncbi:MAG: hypothetical protein ACE5H0_12775, partial [Bacteroidota bacterium]
MGNPNIVDDGLDLKEKQLESKNRDTKLRYVGELTYSQMVQGEFPTEGAHHYTFKAKKGDVVSLFLSPFPRPAIDRVGYNEVLYHQRNQRDIDPQLALYTADRETPLIAATDIISIQGKPKEDHLVHTIPQDGIYCVCVKERYGRKVPYRLRLNRIGGPNMWTTEDSNDRKLNYLGRTIHHTVRDLAAPIPGKECLTYRNAVGPVLHGTAIFFGLRELVANAKFEVAIRSGNIEKSDPLRMVVEGAKHLENRIKEDLKRFNKGQGDKPFYPVVIRIIPDLLVPF